MIIEHKDKNELQNLMTKYYDPDALDIKQNKDTFSISLKSLSLKDRHKFFNHLYNQKYDFKGDFVYSHRIIAKSKKDLNNIKDGFLFHFAKDDNFYCFKKHLTEVEEALDLKELFLLEIFFIEEININLNKVLEIYDIYYISFPVFSC